jgi:hypothetical protein
MRTPGNHPVTVAESQTGERYSIDFDDGDEEILLRGTGTHIRYRKIVINLECNSIDNFSLGQ